MKHISCIFLVVALAVLVGCGTGACQTGTPHGNKVTASPSTGATSYNVYRCNGTCTTAGLFTQVNTQALSTPLFLDPAASLTVGNTYSYVMTAINAAGESAYSNIAVITDTAFPTNPAAPTGCAVSEQ